MNVHTLEMITLEFKKEQYFKCADTRKCKYSKLLEIVFTALFFKPNGFFFKDKHSLHIGTKLMSFTEEEFHTSDNNTPAHNRLLKE